MPGKSPSIISAFEFPPATKEQQSAGKGRGGRKRSVSSAPSRRSATQSSPSDSHHKQQPQRQWRPRSAVDDGRLLTLSPSDSPWGNKEWGRSQYTSDYGPKRPLSPVKIRPASATRMHNPQPSNVRIMRQCLSLSHMLFHHSTILYTCSVYTVMHVNASLR